MPLPRPIIKEIGERARTNVRVDSELLLLRNYDDSYGDSKSNLDSKILVTLQVFLSFIEQGTPRDSDRLSRSYDWLIRNSISCKTIDPPLIRLICRVSIGDFESNYEDFRSDVASVKQFVNDELSNNFRSHQILFLLGMECLLFLKNENQIDEIDESLLKFLSLQSTQYSKHSFDAAEVSYLLIITYQLGLIDKKLIDSILKDILSAFDRGKKLWSNCPIQTAFTVINLSYLDNNDIPDAISEVMISATENLDKLLRDQTIIEQGLNFPKEITHKLDRRLYGMSLTSRALVRSAKVFDNSNENSYALKFAHAYVQHVSSTYDRLRLRITWLVLFGAVIGTSITLMILKQRDLISQIINLIAAILTIVSVVSTYFRSIWKSLFQDLRNWLKN